jgi:methanethiol S-methyltransferase
MRSSPKETKEPSTLNATFGSATLFDSIKPITLALCRLSGILFGVATQLLFLWTVVQLFAFLRHGGTHPSPNWLGIDCLLATGFAVPHSVLLVPPIQKWIKSWMPAGLLGCLHCSVTCIALLILFRYWGTHSTTLWKATGFAETAILCGFYGSWIALFYSLYITGMGYQTGFTQWRYWLLQTRPPQREFVERGAYRWMRHPIYMSFLGLIWFTPTMTLDHAVLTLLWTIYIYAGSYFKDKRMMRFVGPPYQEYAMRVTGLPFIGIGPLRRIR